MKSKTIIISNQNAENPGSGRGIITLFQDDELLQCRLRLYNVTKLNKFCKIGIYHQKQVYSANLLEKNGTYESSLVGEFDFESDFYVAIIDTSDNNNVLLSGGTYAGFYFNDNSVFNGPAQEENNISNSHLETSCKEDCDKCTTCKYKEYFYNCQKDINSLEETHSHIENVETKEDSLKSSTSIISSITPQFDYIFENYTADEELNSLLPNSKFVKINENQEQYSIGALYENEKIKYICYATKCNYNTPAPIELGEHYQWLPIDKEDPLSEGFYIVFQDANDLKIVNL